MWLFSLIATFMSQKFYYVSVFFEVGAGGGWGGGGGHLTLPAVDHPPITIEISCLRFQGYYVCKETEAEKLNTILK
jgi:hypothetical protein